METHFFSNTALRWGTGVLICHCHLSLLLFWFSDLPPAQASLTSLPHSGEDSFSILQGFSLLFGSLFYRTVNKSAATSPGFHFLKAFCSEASEVKVLRRYLCYLFYMRVRQVLDLYSILFLFSRHISLRFSPRGFVNKWGRQRLSWSHI